MDIEAQCDLQLRHYIHYSVTNKSLQRKDITQHHIRWVDPKR